MVGSFSQAVLDEFRALCPETPTSASSQEVLRFMSPGVTSRRNTWPFQALQVPDYPGAINLGGGALIRRAFEIGIEVHVWTVNDSRRMEQLISLGVRGIITDYPDRLFDLIRSSDPHADASLTRCGASEA
jgi:glycerophosphoryl diester phosphodiesterase